jgi:hypothetical protein
MSTPDLIRAAGEALFGSRWQTDLGDALGINRRTVQRWRAGQDEPRPAVWGKLLALVIENEAKLTAVKRRLSAVAPPP